MRILLQWRVQVASAWDCEMAVVLAVLQFSFDSTPNSRISVFDLSLPNAVFNVCVQFLLVTAFVLAFAFIKLNGSNSIFSGCQLVPGMGWGGSSSGVCARPRAQMQSTALARKNSCIPTTRSEIRLLKKNFLKGASIAVLCSPQSTCPSDRW